MHEEVLSLNDRFDPNLLGRRGQFRIDDKGASYSYLVEQSDLVGNQYRVVISQGRIEVIRLMLSPAELQNFLDGTISPLLADLIQRAAENHQKMSLAINTR